jgi:ATP-dependent Clp protease ATP-binding subunit ClpA
MFERFTAAARGVVVNAQQEARELGHPYIGTEHLLLGLIGEPSSATARLLHPSGVDPAVVRADIQRLVGDKFEPDLSFTEADAEDAAALKAIGIDLAKVRTAIEESFGADALRLSRPAPRRRGLFGRRQGGGHLQFAGRAKKVLELSLREALRLHHNFIAPEHIMLGLLREGDGLACRVLADHEVDFAKLRDDLADSLRNEAA